MLTCNSFFHPPDLAIAVDARFRKPQTHFSDFDSVKQIVAKNAKLRLFGLPFESVSGMIFPSILGDF